MTLANNFEQILQAFNANEVDYLITGGYAVIFHGYGRTTGDLDIWINPSKENKPRLLKAFKDLNFPVELGDYLSQLDFKKPFAIRLGEEPIQVDVFNAITGVDYQEASKNSILFEISEGLEVNFLGFNELVINKMLTGRLRDKADVDELQRIKKYEKDS